MSANARVLVVDDDDAFLLMATSALRGSGHKVVSASTGAAAIEIVGSEPFDLLLLDGLLPDGTGIEIVERLRNEGNEVPVLFVSAFWRDAGAFRVLLEDLRVSRILNKPLSPAELRVHVDNELAARSPAPEPEPEPISPQAALEAELAAELETLRRRFEERLGERLEELSEAIEAAAAAPGDIEPAKHARTLAHKLAGTCGTYDFEGVGRATSEIEDAFVALSRAEAPPQTLYQRAREALLRAQQSYAQKSSGVPAPVAAEHGQPVLLVVSALLEPPDSLPGIRVRHATGFATAARRAAAGHIDMAVIDTGLEDGQWQMVARALRERQNALPMALVSARAEALDPAELRVLGFEQLFTPDELKGEGAWAELVESLAEPALAQRPTLLLVDPEEAMRDRLQAALDGRGVRIEHLDRPEDTFERLEALDPDLIIMDVLMPRLSGAELCKALRNDGRWRAHPVLLLSARDDDAARALCFDAGADDFLPRAFSDAELWARVGVRLRLAALRRDAARMDPVTGLLRPAHSDLLPQWALSPPEGVTLDESALEALGSALRPRLRTRDRCAHAGGGQLLLSLPGLRVEAAQEVLAQVAALAAARLGVPAAQMQLKPLSPS